MMFRAFSIDEVTKELMAIEEKGTGPNPGPLSAKQADQSKPRAHCTVLVLHLEGTHSRETQPSGCTGISCTEEELDSLE